MDYTSTDDALVIYKRFVDSYAIVAKDRVAYTKSFFVPIVTERLQITIIIVLAVDFKVNDHTFLFSIDFCHRNKGTSTANIMNFCKHLIYSLNCLHILNISSIFV